MKVYLDKVSNDFETIIITRKSGKNVALLPEEAYNNLLENVYIRSSKANYDWLMQSRKQLEKGEGKTRILEENKWIQSLFDH